MAHDKIPSIDFVVNTSGDPIWNSKGRTFYDDSGNQYVTTVIINGANITEVQVIPKLNSKTATVPESVQQQVQEHYHVLPIKVACIGRPHSPKY